MGVHTPTEKDTLEGAVCPGTTISSCCGVRPPLSTTVRSHARALTQQRCDLLPNDSLLNIKHFFVACLLTCFLRLRASVAVQVRQDVPRRV